MVRAKFTGARQLPTRLSTVTWSADSQRASEAVDIARVYNEVHMALQRMRVTDRTSGTPNDWQLYAYTFSCNSVLMYR
jgi:hypothetical protein